MGHAVIIGGGVAGLGSALALARLGHSVTVLERDEAPTGPDPSAAFDCGRRGAPQVWHSHALLGRLRKILREHYPDVLDVLLEAGATEIDLTDRMPGNERSPGDADLVLIAARRTTFEWALRVVAARSDDITVLDQTVATELLSTPGSPPTVTGVRLADGEAIPADLVIAADGPRSAVAGWLPGIGARPVAEEVVETDIVYHSRFYRLHDGRTFPPTDLLVAGDLGYLKYGIFWGDNGTFSITLAALSGDKEMRALRDPDVFDATTRSLPAASPWIDGRSEPIGKVHSMAGMVNRRRRFVDDRGPVALGLFAVGDAQICTNPLYGRGCTTALWQAELLHDAFVTHPGSTEDQAIAYDQSVDEQIAPWFAAALDADRTSRSAAESRASGRASRGERFRAGLNAARQTDPEVWRVFARTFNLLDPPEALVAPEVIERVIAAAETVGDAAPLGPERDQLLVTLGLGNS